MARLPTVAAPSMPERELSESFLINEQQRGRYQFPDYGGTKAAWPASTAGIDKFCAPDSTSKLPEQGKDRSFARTDLDPK